MNRIEQKFLNFIDEKKLIRKNDKILVALSGGPDSVFLLHLFLKYKNRFKIEIGAIHINHMIRGKAANEDEDFCKKLSLNLNIKFIAVSRDVKSFARKNKLSLEEAGRKIRYSEFEKSLKKLNYNKIATAHNSSDNTETVLLNLIKGTGLKGISGIPISRGNIIRPILNISKEEILNYLNNNGIKYRTDESNSSVDFERNYLRQNIIPLIKEKLNPDLEKSILNSSEIFKNVSSFLDKKVLGELKSITEFKKGQLIISIKKIEETDEEIKSYFLKLAIEENFSVQLTFADYKNIISLIKKETGKKVNLSNSLKAVRERDSIVIFKEKRAEDFKPLVINENGSVKIDEKTVSIKKKDNLPIKFSGSRLKEYISADKLSSNYIIRKWKHGDKFFPLGLKGTKKVSDFLNELKIPSLKKKDQLVLTNRGQIIWVIGLRLDERFKINNNTEKVIELCLK
ncbi:MAG: tRNA lysidine(34) synthetase TilS [Bacteroidetes bacterium]|nr:tRNA lysidine(34) synthetase TilS [Bacteroidota bacterium]